MVMILYDLSIHLIFLFGKQDFWLKRGINYWPEGSKRQYQIFWSAFWSIAFLLLLASII